MTAADEKVEIPPSEKVPINSMADKFKGLMAQLPADAPAKPAEPAKSIAPAPAPAPAPPPAEPAKPAAPAPAPVKPPEPAKPDVASPARENFQRLENEAKRLREEAAAFKAQLELAKADSDKFREQAEALAKLQPEFEATKKDRDEYQKIVKQLYIEHDPQFQTHFNQRVQAALVDAKEAVGPDLAAKVEQILSVPPSSYRDEQLEALTEGMSEFRRSSLVQAYADLKRTERERKAELAKSAENHAKLQEVQAQRAREAEERAAASRAALIQHANAQIDPELTDAAPELAVEIKTRTKAIVEGTANAEAYIGMLVDAARGRKYSALVKDQAEKISKLEAQLASMQTAQPSLGGGAGGGHKPAEPEDMGVKFRRALNQQQ